MADTRHLMKRCGQRRSGERWYVRLRVPTDLRGRFGRARFIDRALHTGDLREAQRRRHAVVAEILADFERARAAPTLDEVVAAARRGEVGRAWAEWRDAYLARGRGHVEEGFGVLIDDQFMRVDDEPDGTSHLPTPGEDWHQRARQVLRRHAMDPTPERVERVAVALLEAHVEAAGMVLEGREPPGLPVPRRSPPARSGGGGEPLSATAERYIADRMRDSSAAWTKQTAAQVRLSARLFAEYVEEGAGVLPGDGRERGVLDWLGTLHKDFARRHETRGMPFAELVERFAGEPTLANRTLNWRTACNRDPGSGVISVQAGPAPTIG